MKTITNISSSSRSRRSSSRRSGYVLSEVF